MIKDVGKRIVRLAGSLITAMVLLSLFSVAYDNSGIKIADRTGATATKWEGKQFVSNMSEGIAWLFTDANGYNNAAVTEPDILLMGDSHFEALQVLQGDNAASRLAEFSGLKTYNIGISGRKIHLCVKSMSYALSAYHPSGYIVFDLSGCGLRQADMESALVPSPASSSNLRFTSGPVYYLKQIPCVKPILYQTQQWMSQDARKTESEKSVIQPDAEYERVMREFIYTIRDRAAEYNVKAIIVYHPSSELQEDGTVRYSSSGDVCLPLFSGLCEEAGVLFVDMTDDFRALYENQSILVNGFINTAVGAGHLNQYGHKLIAERLARVILEDQKQ